MKCAGLSLAETLSIVAMFLGPVVAVVVGLWGQRAMEKRYQESEQKFWTDRAGHDQQFGTEWKIAFRGMLDGLRKSIDDLTAAIINSKR